MKSIRFMLSIILVLLCTVAFAQSDAQKSFDKLKALAGSWEGTYEGKPEQVSFRVTSTGNALMHEATQIGRSEDPITIFYLEGDRLLLTHYCDAGNRPRMVGKMTSDGNTVEFDVLDVANLTSKQFGHMQHVVITILDPNHHTEDWIFMVQGGEPPVDAHYDLRRTK
jgi:hypothetical protein